MQIGHCSSSPSFLCFNLVSSLMKLANSWMETSTKFTIEAKRDSLWSVKIFGLKKGVKFLYRPLWHKGYSKSPLTSSLGFGIVYNLDLVSSGVDFDFYDLALERREHSDHLSHHSLWRSDRTDLHRKEAEGSYHIAYLASRLIAGYFSPQLCPRQEKEQYNWVRPFYAMNMLI